MATRIYDFDRDKPSGAASAELAAAIRGITPAVATLAEEARRRRVIRSCRIIEQHEQQAGQPR